MTDRTKLSLAAAALAVSGIALAPAYSTIAAAAMFQAAGIHVEGPSTKDGLGTIWFNVADGSAADATFRGPH